MLGEIASYDVEKQTGTIRSGKELFQFTIANWLPDAPPEEGDEVKFDIRVTKAININLLGAVLNDKELAVKSKWLAAVLAFFLGWAGIHRLYLGYYQFAVMQMAVTAILVVSGLMGFAMLWGFIEAILLFGGHLDKDAKGRPLK
ncbi:MAG: TM2 domain-containing protein [Methylococcales bacterium]